jgi:hypothetical protein
MTILFLFHIYKKVGIIKGQDGSEVSVPISVLNVGS